MNSEQIKKLAAAGLTVEQIAVVADMLIEVRNEKAAQGSPGTGFLQNNPAGARSSEFTEERHGSSKAFQGPIAGADPHER